MFAQQFSDFNTAVTSIAKVEELNEMAITIFNEVSEKCNLSEYDLLWLGVDCLDQELYKEWSLNYSAIISIAKAASAFCTVEANIFPKQLFEKEVDFYVIEDFANPTQQKAVIKYCLDNGLEDKLFARLETEVYMGEELGVIVISALELEHMMQVTNSETVDGLTFEELELKLNIQVLNNTSNCAALLDAVALCKDDTELANFVTSFGNFSHSKELVYQLHPAYSILTYGHVEVDFSTLCITTSKEFFLRNTGYVVGYGEITGKQLLALVLITITGSNDEFWGQNYLDAYLNSITATEEEQDVYGDQMNESQQLRVIRANSVAILYAEDYFLKYPYIQLKNNNNAKGVDEVAKYYMEKQIPFFVDKIAMKRVVIGAGVTALYAAMDFEKGILKTILDVAKPGKMFTRGWQTLCTPASQGIVGLQKEAVAYVNSNLVLQHYHKNGEVEEITIKGEPAITITGDNNFLINGSGVGYTWKPWAASCKKTLRDSFNAMSLKEGETLEQVKADLTNALNKLLADKSVRKSGSHLLDFRGRPMLSYRGLNQDFVTSTEYGAEFSIRELGTSKTLQITFSVVYIYTDKEPKVRGLGEKTVLKDASKTGALVVDSNKADVKVQALLNSECLKGNASRLLQYAEFCRTILETKGGTPEEYKVALLGGYNSLAMEAIEAPELIQEGDVWTWTGNRTIQSLDDTNSSFYKWWVANTQTYYLHDMIHVLEFLWLLLGRAGLQQEWDGTNKLSQDLLDKALTHEANAKVRLVNQATGDYTNVLTEAEKYTNYVQVEEEFSGVRSLFVFQMELASIRECSNAGQSSTIQQVASVYASNPTLGEALADGIYAKETNKDGKVTKLGYKTIEQEDAILGLIAMSLNDIAIKGIGKEYKPASTLANWTLKDLAAWNNSVFNSGANAIYPANSDPYLAFFDASVSKKFKSAVLVNRVGLTEVKEGCANFTFMQALEGSALNYSRNVGTGYNIGSVATCMAALARYELVKAMQSKEPNSTLQALGGEVKLWGWVNALAWKSCYENAWLASYNDKGEKLSDMLNEYRKGYVMVDGQITVSPKQVIANIKEVLGKVEGIPTSQIADKWVEKLLWTYRIARAVSTVENKAKGIDKALYDLKLDDEDVKYIAVCGAFRRCDQGRFANKEELLVNDSEEGHGTSMWSFLSSEWNNVSSLLPKWLARKLWKAMQVHLAISDTSKAIANKMGDNYYEVDEDILDRLGYDSDKGESTLGSTLDEAVLVRLGIPTIEFEYANQDAVEQILQLPVVNKGKARLEETSDLMSLQGAFMHYTLYCPIKPIKDEVTNKVSFVMDSEVPGAIKVPYAGSPCWLWKRNLTSKEVIQQAAIRYPKGALISASEETNGVVPSVYIDFSDVLKTGAFTTSGAATGFALNLANFLVAMSKKAVESKMVRKEADFRKFGRNQISGLQGQLREMQKAGIIKRVGKSAPNKQGSKIQTTHSAPYIICEFGVIPVFMMNPDDEVALVGGYQTGDFCSVSRTPMIAKSYGVIVLSRDVAVGHLDVSGKVFALSNRGDGDGDPCDLSKENGSVSINDLIKYLGTDVIKALNISLDNKL